ncbi:MAG TPA: DUF3426 domain-containing protein [Rhodocyclaceae bacterium]|nr:DUF3426 domain-containing protein [Rhodocyclaceae bacterium]
MRTRCPRCQTIFRITSEQLRARAGKVRCGHCQSVFNALETLIEEPAALPPAVDIPASPPEIPKEEPAPVITPIPAPEPAPEPEPVREAEPEPAYEPAPEPPEAPEPEPESAPVPEFEPIPEPPVAPEPEFSPEPEPPAEAMPEATEVTPAAEPEPEAAPVAAEEPPREETPEETTQAAREAGLVAARELAETPGYNRWSAGTLASNPLAGLEAEHPRAKWPFVLATLVLVLALLGQLAYYYRTELTQRLPSLADVYAALDIDIPLPRQVELVSIETSDLQSDNARGLLVLQATLKNRANYAQAWPALELALTDTHDAVVARRVLAAADYLPPKVDPTAFPANSETGLRLWIETKDVAAAGYRLYVFYP